MAAIPENNKLARGYRDQGLVLIGIHCDDPAKGAAKVTSMQIAYPVANDVQEQTQKAYGVQGYPTTVVIDRKGIIRYTNPDHLEEVVKKLLAENP